MTREEIISIELHISLIIFNFECIIQVGSDNKYLPLYLFTTE